MARFASICFPHLLTDFVSRKQHRLQSMPFVLAAPHHGRMVIKAANSLAESQGVGCGMVVADCKAILPELEILDYEPGTEVKLLSAIAEWCIRYTPLVGVDEPNGLFLDTSGCAHLWGGEESYLEDIQRKLVALGYDVRGAIADTIGTAWAVARFGREPSIVGTQQQLQALQALPPAALRLEPQVLSRMKKLGLHRTADFIAMPRPALRRRFGQGLLDRIEQALGQLPEVIKPVKPVDPYQERLPSLEPIRTAKGIEIALQELLQMLCKRLESEGMGLRTCIFSAHRIDGNIQQIQIGTGHPSFNIAHLFKLFELKIATLKPDLGFELFVIVAPIVEPANDKQDALWETSYQNDMKVAELLDRLAGKVGNGHIHRYLPDEHHWPERSIKEAGALHEKADTSWRDDLPRPIHLLPKPERIEVTAPIPDYPPMLFRYKGELYHVAKAEGPERIEQEWWLAEELYRDYYCIEDEKGNRYWLFRSGPYDLGRPEWFIHGFFA
ncbi:DNA polymerase Y family protein [Pedobacter sp. ASV28]|uniref:Y-family DNA polymerase n=1 Tax=Pedobacter sp. ASV28 TaxID=2795123 RepID=UPI0018ED3626|nr:DNA polymerase Y family protein [Pedobacter sp. ASV28]